MRAPAKAAITMTKDETASTYWINTIIVMATMSFDPEEIPQGKWAGYWDCQKNT